MMMEGEASSRAVWPFLLLLITLQIIMASTTGRSSPVDEHHLGQAQDTFHPSWEEQQCMKKAAVVSGGEDVEGDALGGGVEKTSALGSRPPSCHRKCGGCSPCAAIQVPTTTDGVGLQYANYEPEGWRCKCGSSFYNP